MKYVVLDVVRETVLIEALDDREVELSLILSKFGEYFRVKFKKNHFKVKNRENNGKLVMEKLIHDVKLTLYVVCNEFFDVKTCGFAKTFSLGTTQLMFCFQAYQNDVLLLVLYFPWKLCKAVEVQ